MTMEHHVCSIEQNMSGTWDARVCMSEQQTMFFNFAEYPTDKQIQSRVDAYIHQCEIEAYLEEQERLRQEEEEKLHQEALNVPPE